jgi:hypothetical protein
MEMGLQGCPQNQQLTAYFQKSSPLQRGNYFIFILRGAAQHYETAFPISTPPSTGYGPLECGTLGCDHRHQFVPGLNERLRPFILEPGGQGVDIDSGLSELR